MVPAVVQVVSIEPARTNRTQRFPLIAKQPLQSHLYHVIENQGYLVHLVLDM